MMKIKTFVSLVGVMALTGLFCPKTAMAQKSFTLEDLNFGGKTGKINKRRIIKKKKKKK